VTEISDDLPKSIVDNENKRVHLYFYVLKDTGEMWLSPPGSEALQNITSKEY
jgi:hypothetical protein